MRLTLFNVAAAVLAVGLFEVYVSLRPEAHRVETSGFYTPDPELGYTIAAGPRTITSVLKGSDGSTIFDVKYTIDRFGLRPVANPVSARADKAIFFVGDSFTFGIGVNDEDTLPQQFSRLSGYRVVNFGIGGHGAHEVLRELELDRLRAVESRDPLAMVYLVLPTNHMLRAAGRAEWDKDGPRYEIVDGSLKYLGHFAPDASIWQGILKSSAIYTKLIAPTVSMMSSDADRERLLAIITKIRDLSRSKYHAPLVVLVWQDSGNSDTKWLRGKLLDEDIPTLSINEAAPELRPSHHFPEDGHPTAEGHAIVAKALNAFLEKLPNRSATQAVSQSLQ
jgi:lysophospholipase L1-like esterase